MKKLLLGMMILGSFSSFAITDVKIIGVVFSNNDFQEIVGKEKINDIEILQKNENSYHLEVNSKAVLVDGCAYSATVLATEETFAIDPLASGIRTVLKVTDVKSTCGWN